MGLLSKIKNALFEETEEEEENGQIAKKIDIEKTISETPRNEEIKIRHYDDNTAFAKEEKLVTPAIFDVEDFVEEDNIEYQEEYQKPIKTEQKIIYGGYVEDKKEETKTKFRPSPVISPVYGLIDINYTPEEAITIDNSKKKSLDNLFMDDRKKAIDLDKVRQKAYGIVEKVEPKVEAPEEINTESNSNGLLYEMEDVEEKPGIKKISIGDAEEYFEDLGLEYDVDYKDLAKDKMTRSRKNKELTEEVEEEIKESKKIEEETQKTDVEKETLEDCSNNETEEKNLYDLIDMMYDNKE